MANESFGDQDPHQQEQTMAEIRTSIPRLWWSLFTGAKEQGFSAAQAPELVKAFIQANGKI